MKRIGIVLMAAGGSTRMGTPKQLLTYAGSPLLRHVADTALATGLRPVIVVLGANAEGIRPTLDGLPVTVVRNDQWQGGMGTSIHAGVAEAARLDLDAVILTLGDQPLISAASLTRLVEEHESAGRSIVASSYANTVGVPVLFTREFFPYLLALQPQEGCKGLILKNATVTIQVPCPEAETDVDTPEQYAALKAARATNRNPSNDPGGI